MTEATMDHETPPGRSYDVEINLSHVSFLLGVVGLNAIGPREDGTTQVWSADGSVTDDQIADAISRQDLNWSPTTSSSPSAPGA